MHSLKHDLTAKFGQQTSTGPPGRTPLDEARAEGLVRPTNCRPHRCRNRLGTVWNALMRPIRSGISGFLLAIATARASWRLRAEPKVDSNTETRRSESIKLYGHTVPKIVQSSCLNSVSGRQSFPTRAQDRPPCDEVRLAPRRRVERRGQGVRSGCVGLQTFCGPRHDTDISFHERQSPAEWGWNRRSHAEGLACCRRCGCSRLHVSVDV